MRRMDVEQVRGYRGFVVGSSTFVALVFVTACSLAPLGTPVGPTGKPTANSVPSSDPGGVRCVGVGWIQEESGYIGLTLEEARAKASAEGVLLRVLGADGDCPPRLADSRSNRVNLYLEDKAVVAAVRG